MAENNSTTKQGEDRTITRVPVQITSDRLNAAIKVTIAAVDEGPITAEEIRRELGRAGVVYGLDEQLIDKLPVDGPFDELVVIACGDPAIAGKDAQITCMFDISPDHSPKADANGRIDYHEVNFLQGINDGHVLMKRIPATLGTPGKAVDGKEISAQDGKDRVLQKGTNTEISEDGMELLATASGAIVFTRGNQVSVRDVVTISEDVDFSTGNIHSPGSVRINGDVRAGFKVHADGDIEILGSVEDAEITSKGNILMKSGFTGRGQGLAKADGNVTIQHVEGQHVIAGHDIKIGGDALNARLEAGGKIEVTSPEGRISGGEIIADKEIKAAFLGSEVWTVTTLKVAGDEKLRQELEEIDAEAERLSEDEKRVKKAIFDMVKLEMAGVLPDASKAALDKLRTFSKELPANLEGLNDIKAKLNREIAALSDAKIIATKLLYPGVKAQFGIVYKDVKEERSSVSMCSFKGRVMMDNYTPDKD